MQVAFLRLLGFRSLVVENGAAIVGSARLLASLASERQIDQIVRRSAQSICCASREYSLAIFCFRIWKSKAHFRTAGYAQGVR